MQLDDSVRVLFWIPLNDEAVQKALDFVLKNWNAENETYEEFYLRCFGKRIE